MDLHFNTTNGISEKWLKNNHKEYYDNINDIVTEENISLSERIYLYQNGLTERPKCENCKIEKVNFTKFYKGYRKYCSRKCAALDTHKNVEIKAKRVEALTKSNNDVELRKEMTERANITKGQFSDERKEEINNKRNETNLEKYGVDIVSKNIDIIKKIVENSKVGRKETNRKKTINNIESNGFNIINIENGNFELYCDTCNKDFIIKSTLFSQRKRFEIDICTKCNPINGSSNFEKKVFDYVKSIYNGDIISNHKKFKKYEIDIYLPELNIGIECNGLYWHSEIYKDKNYHLDKLAFFDELGINIINIWEDDWKYKQDIIKHRLINKLNLNKNVVYGRKCIIKPIDNSSSRLFLDENHIQGWCQSKIKLGIFNNDELIGLATFGNLRRNLGHKNINENEYELLRFCSKKDLNIIGGLSKTISYLKKNYNTERIISYCDRSFNRGDSYIKAGFKLIEKKKKPNYHWFNKNTCLKENRWKYRKDILVKMGYDKNKTEIEIMHSLGYLRIFDCGSNLYEIIL
jgi:hypothetical protein